MNDPSAGAWEVLVAGAGPVGLTLANLLGLQGIRTLVLEKLAGPVATPRAVGLDDECLRIWQACGLADAILPHIHQGDEGDTVFTYRSSAGAPLFRMTQHGRPYGYARGLVFLQHRAEEVLREGARRFPHVEVRPGCTVENVDAADGVARFSGVDLAGRPWTEHAAFGVGCDGGRSTVRSSLGIPMDGRTYPTPWLIVDVHSETAERENRREGVEVWCDARRPTASMQLPHGFRRWEFLLRRGENPGEFLDDTRIRGLIESRKPIEDYRIVRKLAFAYSSRIARRYRSGPVLLAGDACHVSPPFAGQGLATGLRDAANLAWKLAQVARRRLPDSLLDTYEEERRPHQLRMLGLARRLGRAMMPGNRLHEALSHSLFRLTEASPPLKRMSEIRGGHIAPAYRRGFLRPGGAAGTYVLQPRMPDGRLLDEWLGPGFAVISIGDGADRLLGAAENDRWSRLGARFINLPAHAEGTPALTDPPGRRDGPRVLIVRPDRFIFADISS
jgi:3-(3-hydroxy-phenyl)propionate hydroxylase